MKNNLFLTIFLLIAFSCSAQKSIRKVDDNYCRIEIPSKNGNFDCKEDGTKLCNMYYVLEETFFKDKIKNDLIFKLPAFTAVTISFIQVLYEQLGIFKFITVLPLSSIGFNWIIPSFVAFVIALFIKKK